MGRTVRPHRGGILYSEYMVGAVLRRVAFIAPVIVYPGEDEMRSLAFDCLCVLRGEESARAHMNME